MTKAFILLLIIMSSTLYSQEKLEKGQHILKDKLTYIIIKENNVFEYNKYHNFSPLTVKEEREKENKPRGCGTIAYISGAKGKGHFKIIDSTLVLKFAEFEKHMDKETDFDSINKSLEFSISEFID